jgi:phytoene/squalene synthetase
LADRVDVDTIDDKKRKNKGHDRAAELSNFLRDFGEDVRNNPKALDKQKVALAGFLLKMSKQPTESVEENITIDLKFDTMLREAFSGFDIPE